MVEFFLAAVICAVLPAQEPQVESEPTVITLEQALVIALSENSSIKIADKEIERTGYAKKGTYASLFPQIDGSATYQRTIKKQRMYMDIPGMEGGMEVGRFNTWNAGASAAMPLVNAQLWKSLQVSSDAVELAVEQARSSRIQTVTQVKQAFFGVLLAKDSESVYESVYENAKENFELTQKKYNVQKASELDLTRAKTALANAIPNLFDSQSAVVLALWQLKAVMGVDLDADIDVAGTLSDYTDHMLYDFDQTQNAPLSGNSSMRQLAIQAEQLAHTIQMYKAANIPSLALSFSYSINALANDYEFENYKWSPYAYAGITLNIPIFAGGKRCNQIRQAKVQAAELELQKSETERQLKITIRQNLAKMETAIKSLSSAQSAVASAQKAYEIAKQSYQVGRSTLTDLNDAQLALVQARMSESQAVYSFVSAKASLEGVLGMDYVDQEGNVVLNNTYDNE